MSALDIDQDVGVENAHGSGTVPFLGLLAQRSRMGLAVGDVGTRSDDAGALPFSDDLRSNGSTVEAILDNLNGALFRRNPQTRGLLLQVCFQIGREIK